MARSYQVAVGGTTQYAIAGPSQGGGGQVWVTNPTGQPVTVYLGGEDPQSSTLSSTTGFPLAAGATIGPINLAGGETLYGKGTSATTTATVAVFRSGPVK